MAAATTLSPSTLPHSAKPLLLVRMMLPRSQRAEMRLKRAVSIETVLCLGKTQVLDEVMGPDTVHAVTLIDLTDTKSDCQTGTSLEVAFSTHADLVAEQFNQEISVRELLATSLIQPVCERLDRPCGGRAVRAVLVPALTPAHARWPKRMDLHVVRRHHANLMSFRRK